MIQVEVFNFVSLSDAGCVPRIEFGCSRYKISYLFLILIHIFADVKPNLL